jgi:hypothetical protein
VRIGERGKSTRRVGNALLTLRAAPVSYRLIHRETTMHGPLGLSPFAVYSCLRRTAKGDRLRRPENCGFCFHTVEVTSRSRGLPSDLCLSWRGKDERGEGPPSNAPAEKMACSACGQGRKHPSRDRAAPARLPEHCRDLAAQVPGVPSCPGASPHRGRHAPAQETDR